jgi:maltose-binding protein MalE
MASWFKRFLPRYAPDAGGQWSVTLWPEEFRAGSHGGVVWCIPSDAENKDLALEFLLAMRFDDEINLAIFEELNVLPGTTSSLNKPVVLLPDAYFGATLPEAENRAIAVSSLFPYSPSYSLELPIMQQHFDEYSSGQATLEEALNHAQKDLETQIGNALRSNN